MTDVPGLDVAGLAAWIDRVHPELSPAPAPEPEPDHDADPEPDHDANADPEPDAPAARRADGSGITAAVIEGGRSNLTYRIEGARRPLILRRPPLGHVLSSAHDMRREHRVISALGGSAVPVPVAVDIVDDTDIREVTGTPLLSLIHI